MEDGGGHPPSTKTADDGQLSGRARSGSASSAHSHKRSLSGTLLSKLSFLRMSQVTEGTAPKDQSGLDGDGSGDVSPGSRSGRAMATAMQHQRKMRRRRGSLRKTALLGTRLESKEKKSPSARSQDTFHGESSGYGAGAGSPQRSPISPTSPDNEITPRGSIDCDKSNSAPSWPRQRPALNVSTSHHQQNLNPASPSLGDETTTDDEEGVSLPRLNNPIYPRNSSGSSSNGASSGMPVPTPSSSSDSYFPIQPDTMARQVRTTHRARSPLATHSVEMANQEGWDYSETEWWGWIILIVTWLVFVIGMGSCFGVWSWCWDVGETPYAPPELEDDPTLPIVGYYPALMVLTAVMAWVWVVVAWVGMKYFKHANIPGDDG
ncbi:hypothetical protein VTN96DRAFT_6958 [Rasamsonia emersonii]|uniref:Uncharacterized protein n=1 Tax=Rasamsonia emersonii (strain ATCC 16479 / CBS 393.64 / IMI 116815) TaxID=1408163 RepID=A0A0F4YIW7_RASE3|nr:hypothetical protein T310_7902 [Rasamsonia emersonii CBS 393.64]KKA18149.1 hypothetical protein T310_7902 [Rasamsonia emersonii CBS 393.64]